MGHPIQAKNTLPYEKLFLDIAIRRKISNSLAQNSQTNRHYELRIVARLGNAWASST
jgi:hypothetical protein